MRQLDLSLLVAAGSGDIDSAKNLLEQGANVDARDEFGSTPLIAANQSGHPLTKSRRTEISDLLIAYGADVNAINCKSETALMHAVDTDNISTIQLLVQKGADLRAEDGKSRTAFDWARRRGYRHIEKLLISK